MASHRHQKRWTYRVWILRTTPTMVRTAGAKPKIDIQLQRTYPLSCQIKSRVVGTDRNIKNREHRTKRTDNPANNRHIDDKKPHRNIIVKK